MNNRNLITALIGESRISFDGVAVAGALMYDALGVRVRFELRGHLAVRAVPLFRPALPPARAASQEALSFAPVARS